MAMEEASSRAVVMVVAPSESEDADDELKRRAHRALEEAKARRERQDHAAGAAAVQGSQVLVQVCQDRTSKHSVVAVDAPPHGTSGASSAPRRSRQRPSIDFKKIRTWPALQLVDEVQAAYHILCRRPVSTLRIITWNVWFDDIYAHQRQRALLKELLQKAPDVACLQEVLPAFASTVRECGDINNVYDVSPQDVQPYGVMLLVRKDFRCAFSETPLQSNMGRKLLSADCTERVPGLLITNVHLESLNTQETRKVQLQRAARLMSGRPRTILCGDFNFDDTKTWGDWKRERPACSPGQLENRVLHEQLPSYYDCWREVKPEDPGYTFDGQRNPVNCQDREEQMRYDRVMAARAGFVPQSAEMLGTEVLEDCLEWGLRPSDHFGLLVDLEVLKPSDEVKEQAGCECM